MHLLAATKGASALLSEASLDAASRRTLSPCNDVLHSECQRSKQCQSCNRFEAARQISSEAAAAEGIKSIPCAEGMHEDVRI